MALGALSIISCQPPLEGSPAPTGKAEALNDVYQAMLDEPR